MSVILKALSSKPTLHMHVDTHFISSHTFAKEIVVTSFASRVASTLTSVLPDPLTHIVLEYSDTLDNYTTLSGDVFIE